MLAPLESVKPPVGGDIDRGQGTTVFAGAELLGCWDWGLGVRDTCLRRGSEIDCGHGVTVHGYRHARVAPVSVVLVTLFCLTVWRVTCGFRAWDLQHKTPSASLPDTLPQQP